MADGAGPRTGVIAIGVVVLVVGAIAALWLWLAADERYDDGVIGLARAPVGCDAVLDFDDTGEFFVFVETTGRVADVRGDCDVAGVYDLEARPEVDVTVLDPDRRPLELTPDAGVDYDRAGFQGTSVATVEVTEAADHVIRVESDTVGFVVAIGRDPQAGAGVLRVAALGVGVLGGGLGLAIVGLGLRGRRSIDERPGRYAPMAPTPGESWYATGPPTSPPGSPPPRPTEPTEPIHAGPPAGPPTRIPGEPLSPGRWLGGPGSSDTDDPPGGRPMRDTDDPPTGPRIAPPGPVGPRRAPPPPPGDRPRREDENRDDDPRSPWAPPEP